MYIWGKVNTFYPISECKKVIQLFSMKGLYMSIHFYVGQVWVALVRCCFSLLIRLINGQNWIFHVWQAVFV